MINKEENERKNVQLLNLYNENKDGFLLEYIKIYKDENPPDRLNEFGIVDTENYDGDIGVLFIAKESNGWSNEDFEKNKTFRQWLHDISSSNNFEKDSHTQKHPTMWYNVGRWAKFLTTDHDDIEALSSQKIEALSAIGRIAYTNVNKVRGSSSSGKMYDKIAKSDVARKLLGKEIEIIKPKIIVCCGTYNTVKETIKNKKIKNEIIENIKVIAMPHPASRINKFKMLEDLKSGMV